MDTALCLLLAFVSLVVLAQWLRRWKRKEKTLQKEYTAMSQLSDEIFTLQHDIAFLLMTATEILKLYHDGLPSTALQKNPILVDYQAQVRRYKELRTTYNRRATTYNKKMEALRYRFCKSRGLPRGAQQTLRRRFEQYPSFSYK